MPSAETLQEGTTRHVSKEEEILRHATVETDSSSKKKSC